MLASSARADLYLLPPDRGDGEPLLDPGRGVREPRGRDRRRVLPPHRQPAVGGLAAAARDRVVLHGDVRARRRRRRTAARSASSCGRRATRSGCGRGRRSRSARTSPGPRPRRRTCCARRPPTPISRCARPATRRGSPGSDEVTVAGAVRGARSGGGADGRERRALRREEHAEETVDGAGGGADEASGDGRRSRRRRAPTACAWPRSTAPAAPARPTTS